jgi:hypothetical protein
VNLVQLIPLTKYPINFDPIKRNPLLAIITKSEIVLGNQAMVASTGPSEKGKYLLSHNKRKFKEDLANNILFESART